MFKKFYFKSITSRINFVMITLVIISMLIISSIVIYHLINQARDDYQRSIDQQLNVLDHEISLYAKGIIENTKMLAEFPIIKMLDDDIMSYANQVGENGLIPMVPEENSDYEQMVFDILNIFQETHSAIRNASVGVEANGGFVKSPPSPRFDGYDARERSWYKTALEHQGEVTVPGIYKTSSNENVILSVTTIKNNNDEIVGVISIDFELTDLSEIISTIKIGVDGYVILTDKFGTILAHPQDTTLISTSISDTKYNTFIENQNVVIKEQLITGENNLRYNVESRKSELSTFDLYYLVVIEESEYFISAKRVVNRILMSIGLLLIIALIYARLMSRRLTKPIVALTLLSDKLAKGELDNRLSLERFDEIGQLASSFNIMAEALEQSKLALERKVAERTSELSNTNEHLKETNKKLLETLDLLQMTQSQLVMSEKLAGLGAMVSGLAHEINTPLGTSLTMGSFLESLILNLKKITDSKTLKQADLDDYIEKTKDGIIVLNRGLENMIQIVDHFKEVSVHQSSESRVKINLLRQINAAVALWENDVNFNDYRFDIQCEKDLVIDFYPNAFRQVLHHFIDNTMKYAYSKQDDKLIEILVLKKNDNIQLSYSDYGKGMRDKEASHIFEPFFTTYRHEGSMGLGLHIVYNIVTYQLKGEIQVLSSENKGTKFIINVPLQKV